VDTLDLEPIFDVYEQGDGRGQPPYHPAMMVKLPPNVRIDVACGKQWKAGREREKGSESTTNGRVSQSGSTKVSESGVAVGGGSGAGVGSIELVSLSMEQALW